MSQQQQVEILEKKIQVLQAQLGEARKRMFALNSAMAALVREKHRGRCYLTIPTFAETQGWTVDMMPQKVLGNVRFTCVDKNGHPQFQDDEVTDPNATLCCFEGCGAPAKFAEGLSPEGNPLNPRCAAHLPDGASVHTNTAIVPMPPVVEPTAETTCPGCGRAVGHNLDCPKQAGEAA